MKGRRIRNSRCGKSDEPGRFTNTIGFHRDFVFLQVMSVCRKVNSVCGKVKSVWDKGNSFYEKRTLSAANGIPFLKKAHQFNPK